MLRAYRTRGEMEEWYTPCHGIPQFEYTHFDCQQLVQSIVKQEELSMLKTSEGRNDAIESGSSVKDLPEPVLNALLGMPVTNQRMAATSDGTNGNGGEAKKWYEYYDQESLNLTFELYQHDFEIFQYSPAISERPDLVSPQLAQDVLASSSPSNVDGALFPDGAVGGSGGMEISNGAHQPPLVDDRDVEMAGARAPADADPGYQELRRIGTHDSNGAGADDGQLSKSGGSTASSPAILLSPSLSLSSSSVVEIMRRNSNESDRERRLKLIMSSSHVSSRRTSMRQEPLGGSLATAGSVASSSLSSSVPPYLSASVASRVPSTPPRPSPAVVSTTTANATTTAPPATTASSMSSSTHTATMMTMLASPSPPRLSVLVPTIQNLNESN
jgi:hypothetical protein